MPFSRMLSLRLTCRFPWRVLQAAILGHEYSARDYITITLNITVWLPGPRAAIEVDTVGLPFLLPYKIPVIIGGKGADQHAPSPCAWEM